MHRIRNLSGDLVNAPASAPGRAGGGPPQMPENGTNKTIVSCPQDARAPRSYLQPGQKLKHSLPPVIALIVLLTVSSISLAADSPSTNQPPGSRNSSDSKRPGLPDTLNPQEWLRVERAVDHALEWLSSQQQSDGSFSSAITGQPAVTSFCVLAFLSRGHQPGPGRYGKLMIRAIDFVLKSQHPDGLLNYGVIEPTFAEWGTSQTATYNHAIAGLMLTEVYGSSTGEQGPRIKQAVEKAVRFTCRIQREPAKRSPSDIGGWRYVTDFYRAKPRSATSDLSATGWHLMFLRSAKNAGFTVPDGASLSAIEYVEHCFDPQTALFYYGLDASDHYSSRGMMGAGILSLSLGGKHQTEMAKRAGDWLLVHPFSTYGQTVGGRGDRFCYSAYYCSQAMIQLGGNYWKSFFPPLVKTFLQNQANDGAWPAENGGDQMFGRTYTTALAVLTLTPPFQLLPIYQR
jgi:hypothetical protein